MNYSKIIDNIISNQKNLQQDIYINKYDLLGILFSTKLIKYKEQILKLANDMKYVNGKQNSDIYEKYMKNKKPYENLNKNELNTVINYSMTKDINFYEFMDLLKSMIYFIEK